MGQTNPSNYFGIPLYNPIAQSKKTIPPKELAPYEALLQKGEGLIPGPSSSEKYFIGDFIPVTQPLEAAEARNLLSPHQSFRPQGMTIQDLGENWSYLTDSICTLGDGDSINLSRQDNIVGSYLADKVLGNADGRISNEERMNLANEILKEYILQHATPYLSEAQRADLKSRLDKGAISATAPDDDYNLLAVEQPNNPIVLHKTIRDISQNIAQLRGRRPKEQKNQAMAAAFAFLAPELAPDKHPGMPCVLPSEDNKLLLKTQKLSDLPKRDPNTGTLNYTFETTQTEIDLQTGKQKTRKLDTNTRIRVADEKTFNFSPEAPIVPSVQSFINQANQVMRSQTVLEAAKELYENFDQIKTDPKAYETLTRPIYEELQKTLHTAYPVEISPEFKNAMGSFQPGIPEKLGDEKISIYHGYLEQDYKLALDQLGDPHAAKVKIIQYILRAAREETLHGRQYAFAYGSEAPKENNDRKRWEDYRKNDKIYNDYETPIRPLMGRDLTLYEKFNPIEWDTKRGADEAIKPVMDVLEKLKPAK